jgi:hypothetical protein
MEEKNLFADVNAGKSKLTNTIKRTAKAYLPYILLILNIVFRIVIQLYDTKVVNPFSPVFLLDSITTIISTMFCYIVFIPLGEDNERLNSPSYKPNCARWGELSTRIRTKGLLEPFRQYCKEQIEVERREIKAVLIGNNTTLSFEEYTEHYSELSEAELTKLYEEGKLTKGEYKTISKCNNKIKVEPINSVLILSGVARATYNDAGRDGGNYILRWLAQRPIFIIAVSIIINALSANFIGLAGYSVIYSMVIDALCIIFASIVGYGAGEQAIREKEDKIKNRILFIESFLEKEKTE